MRALFLAGFLMAEPREVTLDPRRGAEPLPVADGDTVRLVLPTCPHHPATWLLCDRDPTRLVADRLPERGPLATTYRLTVRGTGTIPIHAQYADGTGPPLADLRFVLDVARPPAPAPPSGDDPDGVTP